MLAIMEQKQENTDEEVFNNFILYFVCNKGYYRIP